MKRAVGTLQVGRIEMRIYLRSRDIGVSEKFLHRPKVRPAAKQMGREGVPERMQFRRIDRRMLRERTKSLPHPFSRKRRTSIVEKEVIVTTAPPQ